MRYKTVAKASMSGLTSRGQSGSPVYFYDSATANRPTIVGVHVGDDGATGAVFPGNWMTRITSSIVTKLTAIQ